MRTPDTYLRLAGVIACTEKPMEAPTERELLHGRTFARTLH